MPTREDVLNTAAAWLWTPYDAEVYETEHAKVVVKDGRGSVHRIGGLPAAALVAHVRNLAPSVPTVWGVHDLTVPHDLAATLLGLGATVEEDFEVLALDLADGVPELPVPDDIEVRRADSSAVLDLIYPVTAAAFGKPPVSAAFRDGDIADTARQVAAGRDRTIFRYLGLVEGVPAAHAALTLDDGVAKLWGGCVVEEYRSRGAYRAVMAARFAQAVAHGARYALVKARRGTSSPILRRVGFGLFGSELQYLLPAAQEHTGTTGLAVGVPGSCDIASSTV